MAVMVAVAEWGADTSVALFFCVFMFSVLLFCIMWISPGLEN